MQLAEKLLIKTVLVTFVSVFFGIYLSFAAEKNTGGHPVIDKKNISDCNGKINTRCLNDFVYSDEIVAKSLKVTVERLKALKKARTLTNCDICSMPQKALDRAFSRLDKPKPDHPGEWATFRNLQRRGGDGKVKPDGLIRAIEKRHDIMRQMTARMAAGNGFVIPAAGIRSHQWMSIGPGNIGGRIRAILIDPSNTDRIWIGGVAGGIWFSPDRGMSWSPVDDFMGNLSISSLVMTHDNPNILYAGTGEGFFNFDAVRGSGIFKSVDGGVTWFPLQSTNPSNSSDWYYVNKIAIHPFNSNIILAATRGGIYRTSDAGVSWTKVTSFYFSAHDIAFNPNNPDKAVFGSGGTSEGWTGYSTDAGNTWRLVQINPSGMIGRVELSYAKSESDTVYASVESEDYGQIWKSVNGGTSWIYVSTPAHLGNQGWYDNAIWVDPFNPSHIVIGGIDLHRSTDGGFSWTRISSWINNMYNGYPDVPHADHHVIVADPGYNGSTNRTVYNANDGGVFRSDDIFTAGEISGWTTLNNNLSITQFYSGAGIGSKIIGGTQDNGSLLRVGGTEWRKFFGGDGGYSAVDRNDPNYIYGEYVYLTLHRSTDGGSTDSIPIYEGITDANSAANFIAPFVLDPNDTNRMLAGGVSLWQSCDIKASVPAWRAIKPPVDGYYGTPISAISVAEGNSDIVWVGDNDGRVYRTTNSLSSSPVWTKVGESVLPGWMVTRILIDKDNEHIVYVCYGGYSSGNVFKTTDNGLTWKDISGNLPEVPVFSIVRHPSNSDWLYLATEVGLFTSENGGDLWSTTNDGPANTEISDLTWLNTTTLLAATHGRGMFTAVVNNVDSFSVSGTVRSGNTSGPVISGATVSLDGKTSTTSSAGKFTISEVTSGSKTVRISKTGYHAYSGSMTVRGNVTGGLTLVMKPAEMTYIVSGTVRSGNMAGPVISGATVSLDGKTATTSSAGKFAIGEMTSGSKTVRISKAGYQAYSGSMTIKRNLNDLTFIMKTEIIGANGNK